MGWAKYNEDDRLIIEDRWNTNRHHNSDPYIYNRTQSYSYFPPNRSQFNSQATVKSYSFVQR